MNQSKIKEKYYACVKFRNGKEVNKKVHTRSRWLYPLIAMIITTIIAVVIVFTIPEWLAKIVFIAH